VLVEIHANYRDQIAIAKKVDWVYDFALPALVLNALYSHSAITLKHWLTISPRNCITVLDTHDGIGVIDVGPERRDVEVLPGLLTSKEIDNLVEMIHARSDGESRLATGAAANNLDLYQVNCTYFDALGRRDNEYLIARALQVFAPGIPQIYYVGLLAGANDLDLLRRTGVGRDINRHYYSPREIDSALTRPVVSGLCDLIRFRNTHPAFAGEFRLLSSADHELHVEWRNGDRWARLEADLNAMAATVVHSDSDTECRLIVAPGSMKEIPQ
jgi:sucrose phosphorylase